MNELLSRALSPVILIYVVSAMLALGLSQSVTQVLAPLRNVRLTISAVVASYVILPLIAALTARVLGLEPALRHGLVLIAMAGGAEVGPLLAANSRANVRLAGGILVMSIPITIVYLPVMLGVVLPDVHFDVRHLLVKLSLTIVAPLVLGFAVRARFERRAQAAAHYLHGISRIFVILVTVIVILLYYQRILGLLGTRAPLAALISVVAGFGIGYVLGWPDRGTRLAMAYMHGARNASVAVMVASDVFRGEPNMMLMIATVVVLILGILIPLSYVCRVGPGPADGHAEGLAPSGTPLRVGT